MVGLDPPLFPIALHRPGLAQPALSGVAFGGRRAEQAKDVGRRVLLGGQGQFASPFGYPLGQVLLAEASLGLDRAMVDFLQRTPGPFGLRLEASTTSRISIPAAGDTGLCLVRADGGGVDADPPRPGGAAVLAVDRALGRDEVVAVVEGLTPQREQRRLLAAAVSTDPTW